MLIFSLDRKDKLAHAIAAQLDRATEPHEERSFPDGERKVRPLVDPGGADVPYRTAPIRPLFALHQEAARPR